MDNENTSIINDTTPQYESADGLPYEHVDTHEINCKLTVQVYSCDAIDGRVFGLKHFDVPTEMLITEATLKELVQKLHL